MSLQVDKQMFILIKTGGGDKGTIDEKMLGMVSLRINQIMMRIIMIMTRIIMIMLRMIMIMTRKIMIMMRKTRKTKRCGSCWKPWAGGGN